MSPAARLITSVAALALVAAGPLPGTEGAACAPQETGPALKVVVEGLKDRRGLLRLELYPADDGDFLADDTVLLKAGKVFRRVDVPTSDATELCIRAPEPGRYAAVVLHDRNSDHRFDPFVDGAGFPNNPRLGFSKPKAAAVSLMVGPGVTSTTVVLNYWNGLSFAPHHSHR